MKNQNVQEKIYKVPVGYAYVLADGCSFDINLYHDDFTFNETRDVEFTALKSLGNRSVFLVENPEVDPDIADPYAVFICEDDLWIVCENTFNHLFLWSEYQEVDSKEVYRKLGPTESVIEIWQITKLAPETKDIWFETLDYVRQLGKKVSKRNYDYVYQYSDEYPVTLEDIKKRFMFNRPNDFKGHRLAVSDVIVIKGPVSTAAFYCDGNNQFIQIPEFLLDETSTDETQTSEVLSVTNEKEPTRSNSEQDMTYLFIEADQPLPEQVETGEMIHTPRGDFSVVVLSQEDMEALGYGVHHSSKDGRYLIMGNGTCAYAVQKDTSAPSIKLIPIELFNEKFKEQYEFLYEAESGGMSVAGYYDAIEAGETFVHQHNEFVAEFIRYRRDFISSDREIAAFMFALSCFD